MFVGIACKLWTVVCHSAFNRPFNCSCFGWSMHPAWVIMDVSRWVSKLKTCHGFNWYSNSMCLAILGEQHVIGWHVILPGRFVEWYDYILVWFQEAFDVKQNAHIFLISSSRHYFYIYIFVVLWFTNSHKPVYKTHFWPLGPKVALHISETEPYLLDAWLQSPKDAKEWRMATKRCKSELWKIIVWWFHTFLEVHIPCSLPGMTKLKWYTLINATWSSPQPRNF